MGSRRTSGFLSGFDGGMGVVEVVLEGRRWDGVCLSACLQGCLQVTEGVQSCRGTFGGFGGS